MTEYMSKEGYGKLASELDNLIKEKLPRAIQAISEARDKGDLSENYEYRAARREQSRVLGRIRFLQRVLAHARVMPEMQTDDDSVQLLTTVGLLNLATQKHMTYTIVSPHEASAVEGKISIKSPVAKALLGRRKGDEVAVKVPIGVLKLRVESVSR